MRLVHQLALATILLSIAATPARAEGFIVPFMGYNFGGDSGDTCLKLTDCEEKRLNYGVGLGSMGKVFGFEEDISYAKNFFGERTGSDNSVFSAMSNLLIGVGVGPVRPYFVGGFGLIRPHVSSLVGSLTSIDLDKNALGYDWGGGISFMFGHVGIRGDLRQFRTMENVNLLVFSSEKLDFWRASAGFAITF